MYMSPRVHVSLFPPMNRTRQSPFPRLWALRHAGSAQQPPCTCPSVEQRASVVKLSGVFPRAEARKLGSNFKGGYQHQPSRHDSALLL